MLFPRLWHPGIGSNGVLTPPDVSPSEGQELADRILAGTIKFRPWAKEMVALYGNNASGGLRRTWNEASETAKREQNGRARESECMGRLVDTMIVGVADRHAWSHEMIQLRGENVIPRLDNLWAEAESAARARRIRFNPPTATGSDAAASRAATPNTRMEPGSFSNEASKEGRNMNETGGRSEPWSDTFIVRPLDFAWECAFGKYAVRTYTTLAVLGGLAFTVMWAIPSTLPFPGRFKFEHADGASVRIDTWTGKTWEIDAPAGAWVPIGEPPTPRPPQ